MTGCAPFRVERSQERLPKFPSRKACFMLREVFGDTECVCRIYQGLGFYVIGSCNHAHGWDLDKRDAEAQCKRLNEGAADMLPALQEPEPVQAAALTMVTERPPSPTQWKGVDLASGPDRGARDAG